jgi:diacylglycerol kinase (ATP)
MATLLPAVVLLNPASGGGRGLARWAKVEGAVAAGRRLRIVQTDVAGTWRSDVRWAMAEGARLFIAAGGDGTVSALVDELVRGRDGVPLEAFTLGAVGLGSSNDFHKPFARSIGGVPVRIEPSCDRRDVCVARYVAADGATHSRCFLISASVGVVAEANAFFNEGDRVERWLRGKWTGGAILYAAQRTIATFRNIDARLTADGRTEEAAITNLSISKTPFVSGMFRYDASVSPDDGLLAVHLCEAMSRVETLRALADLARGRFQGRPKRRHWRSSRVALAAGGAVALELDGEVCLARRVSFGVLAEKVGICR